MSEGLVPPNDLDAEATVLSACMFYDDAFDKVSRILKPEHFYASANQRIFETMCELNKIGKPLDAVSVAGHLRERGNLQKAGGAKAIADLCDSIPATVNVETHARTVAEKAVKRSCIKLCQTLATEGYQNNQSLSEWLLEVEARIFEVTRLREDAASLVLLADAAKTEFESMRERAANPDVLPGITTGFNALDKKIGGWRRGAKYTIAGRPGSGKSSLMLDHAIAAAEAGYGVVIVSLEMPREQLVQRIIAQMSRVAGTDLDRPHLLTSAQWKDVTAAITRINGLPIAVRDSATAKSADIRAAVREGTRILKSRFGDKIDVALVAIDYIQIMEADGKGTRENEVSALSSANRKLAKDENCAVLELAQLNRSVEARQDKRPLLSDLRESGGIENDSFGVIMVYRDDYYKPAEAIPDGEAELLVRKIRQYGSTGVVKVRFDGKTTHFFNDDTLNGNVNEFDDFPVDNGSF